MQMVPSAMVNIERLTVFALLVFLRRCEVRNGFRNKNIYVWGREVDSLTGTL